MQPHAVAVFGASGYAGLELTSLLAHHPKAALTAVVSDSRAGSTVNEATGLGGAVGGLRYVSTGEGVERAVGSAAALLATPVDVSLTLAPRLAAAGCKVVDLSGAFRLANLESFSRAYGRAHPAPEWVARSVYGLPELSRAMVPGAAIVANPGCYPTAAALALGPLLRAGLVEPADLVIDAMSGASGAGRRASEEYSFVELYGDARAYKVLAHQHTPEIEETLARFAGRPVSLTFTPHLVPIARGILCTSYGRLACPATARDLTEALRQAYAAEPFVRVAEAPEAVSLRRVVGTNECLIGVAAEARAGGRVVVVSAIDNLIKGAAGQAIQNLNLALGWEESAGLGELRRIAA